MYKMDRNKFQLNHLCQTKLLAGQHYLYQLPLLRHFCDFNAVITNAITYLLTCSLHEIHPRSVASCQQWCR